MPSYSWEGVTHEGIRRTGTLEAPGRSAVLQELEKQGVLPIHVSEHSLKKQRRFSFGGGVKLKTIEKILLCRHIAVMIKAGIAMNPALSILIADTERAPMKRFLQNTQETIRRGQPLWTAFSAYSKIFPPYFVGLIRAGEASGQLVTSFEQAADQLARENRSRRAAISAMIYPLILLFVSTGLVLFLFLFAIPRMAEAIRQVNTELPLFSRIVFGMSDFFQAYPVVVFLGLVLGLVLFSFVIFSRIGRLAITALAWRFPPSRSFMKKFAMARFARTLGLLMKAGLPAVEAVEITSGSVGIEQIRLAVLNAKERIRSGSTFTDAFKAQPKYFPNLLTGMMAVGEQSGQLSDLLITVSEFFEEDADRALATLVALIEPIMLLGMGLMVATIALAVILPVYQLVSAVGGA